MHAHTCARAVHVYYVRLLGCCRAPLGKLNVNEREKCAGLLCTEALRAGHSGMKVSANNNSKQTNTIIIVIIIVINNKNNNNNNNNKNKKTHTNTNSTNSFSIFQLRFIEYHHFVLNLLAQLDELRAGNQVVVRITQILG